MSFRQLKYITTVAEYKSITKAAKALYISQPSLSHYILKVENEMGVKLFDRSTSPLSLTYAGEQYLDTAHKILKLEDNLNKTFRDISNNLKGRLRIGLPKERAAFMLPEILAPFKKQFPGIEIQTFASNSYHLIDALKKGRIDFMISPYTIEDQNIMSELIYEEELVLVASKDMINSSHCLKSSPNTIDMQKIQDIPFILLKEGHSVRASSDHIFRTSNITPDIFMETTSNITAYRMAASGLGLAIVPRMTMELANSKNPTEIYSVSEMPYLWEVKLSFRKDTYMGIPEKALLEISRNIFLDYSFKSF